MQNEAQDQKPSLKERLYARRYQIGAAVAFVAMAATHQHIQKLNANISFLEKAELKPAHYDREMLDLLTHVEFIDHKGLTDEYEAFFKQMNAHVDLLQ